MSAEERLEKTFQEGVALLEKGESPARAARTLNLNGDTDEIVPLLQIVDTAYELKRYRMPAATKAALLARLTEQIEDKDRKPLIFIPPADTSADEPIRFTPRRDRQQRWNLFLRVQQAVVAAALVVALAFIILQSTGQNNTSLTTPTPAVTSTAVPSPVATLTPAPPVTPTPEPTHRYYNTTEMPAPTANNMPNMTVAPLPTGATIPTGTAAPSPTAFISPTTERTGAPTTRSAVTTQSDQGASNNNTQAAVKTAPPAVPTATPRVVAPTAKPAVVQPTTSPNTVAAQPNPTATPVPPTTAPPAPTNTQVNTPVPVPTNTPAPVPTNTPVQQVIVTTQAPNTTAPPTTVDDHGGSGGNSGPGGGGNSGSGSTKTPSPTPAPTPTKKPSGKG